MEDKIKMNGSLHSHGCWTDHRNPEETVKFPFNLENFARLCIECGRDFQVVSEVKDTPEEPSEWHNERRYYDLMKTANPNSKSYELNLEGNVCTVNFRDNSRVKIIRGQEVAINPHKHISVLDIDKDLKGGLDTRETLRIIREEGGYAIANHPFVFGAWDKEEILNFYNEGLLLAAEWNGKITPPALIGIFFSLIGKEFPSKRDNHRVLQLEKIPIIANDDADSESDMRNGAYTSYNIASGKNFIESIFDSIARRDFIPHLNYSPFLSLFHHKRDIDKSAKAHKEGRIHDYTLIQKP